MFFSSRLMKTPTFIHTNARGVTDPKICLKHVSVCVLVWDVARGGGHKDVIPAPDVFFAES